MSEFLEQPRASCFPLTLIVDGFTPHTESVPDFLHNLGLSDLYNLPGEFVPMNPEIFSAMRAGNRAFLVKMRSYGTPMACLKNDKGDTILHLAAAMGHVKLVERIISEWPSLLLEPNWKDQIPIHTAARAGRPAIVETLVRSITYFSAMVSDEERERFSAYVLKDRDGDTPLHSALKGDHLETALCLVNASNHGSFLENNDGISPLYMAVEAGGLALVKAMLNGLGNNLQGQVSYLASQLEGRKWLVHAALKAENTDILDVILDEDPSLLNERDEEGRTCLSVGASVGFYKGVCKLLDRSTSSVFECNDDGSFPIHVAVEKGHVGVAKEILKRCPDSIELLNKKGQNILHIAAKSGKARSLILKYIKRLDRKRNHLMEEQDEDGNTPLHLATINWRPRSVRDLTRSFSKGTKVLNIKNNDGLRPLDIAELNLHSNYIYRERLTLMALLFTYKPSGYYKISPSGITLRSRSELVDANKYKDSVNVLLVVATLVATVTFAAGIAIPGGFNSKGMAVLPNNSSSNSSASYFGNQISGASSLISDDHLFKFMVADAVAMLSSIGAIIALIWAQLGDPELIHRALKKALPALSLALTSMTTAFLITIISITFQNNLLVLVIFAIYVFFALGNSFIINPSFGPYYQAPRFSCSRWIMNRHLNILLRFVDEDDAATHHNPGSDQNLCVTHMEK